MAIEPTRVPGRNAGRVMLYALSTCVWCRKAKQLLKDLGVEFRYVDVDLLSGEERRQADEIVRRWNPRANFPTIVVDDARCIAGFDEAKIRKAFGP